VTNFPNEECHIIKVIERLSSRQAQAAWVEFLQAFSPIILQIVQLFEREPDHISDCFLFVCEGLARKQFRRLRRFKPDGRARFTTWLRAVVRNLCLDWHRKEFSRERIFKSILRLATPDPAVFYCIYEQGYSKEECLHSLRPRIPQLTMAQVNASLDRVRRALTPRQLWLLRSRHSRIESLEAKSASEQADPAPDPEALSVREEQRSVLERILGQLSKPDRLLIRLRFEQELTLHEIAELLTMKDAQTVDRRIREILETIRKKVASDPGFGGKTGGASV